MLTQTVVMPCTEHPENRNEEIRYMEKMKICRKKQGCDIKRETAADDRDEITEDQPRSKRDPQEKQKKQ